MRQIDTARTQSVLINAVLEKKTIPQIMQCLYEVTGLPSICFDAAFVLLGYTFECPFYFPHWNWIVERGLADEQTILKFSYFDAQEKMLSNESAAIFDTDTTDGFSQACTSVRIGGRLYAYCGIMIEDACPDSVIAVCNQLSAALSATIRRETRIAKRKSLINPIVLNADALSFHEISCFRKAHRGDYLFAVIKFNADKLTIVEYICRTINAKDSFYAVISDDSAALLVLACDLNTDDKANIRTFFENICSTYSVSIAVSDYFSEPAEIPIHRCQAQNIHDIIHNKPAVTYFTDVYADIIGLNAIKHLGPSLCILPELVILDTTDKLTGSKYMTTLRAWHKCRHKKSSMADYLEEHDHTIRNRMMRITEITGKNPDDYSDYYEIGLKFYDLIFGDTNND